MANNGAKDTDYVVGLDIGTSKVVCIIGKYVDSILSKLFQWVHTHRAVSRKELL